MVTPTCFGITLPSSGSVPSAFWEMLNWGSVDRILWMGVLCLVTWCAPRTTSLDTTRAFANLRQAVISSVFFFCFLCCVDRASWIIWIITNTMHCLSSVYWIITPLHVSDISTAHHQEAECIQYMWQLVLVILQGGCLSPSPSVNVCMSVHLSVCLSIRMEQFRSHVMYLHNIWYLGIFRKSVENN
jgi:hypothetical protein